jgi:cytochrome c-type biogenesis protein CcmE
MHPLRRRRLIAIGFLVVGVAVTLTLVLRALEENINLFYPPDKIVSGAAPVDVRIRAGGMVAAGSVEHAKESLFVRFGVTDHAGSDFFVEYEGMLPDLFREGQGVMVTGRLRPDGVFAADEVLAKHDENYMPPEIAHMREKT